MCVLHNMFCFLPTPTAGGPRQLFWLCATKIRLFQNDLPQDKITISRIQGQGSSFQIRPQDHFSFLHVTVSRMKVISFLSETLHSFKAVVSQLRWCWMLFKQQGFNQSSNKSFWFLEQHHISKSQELQMFIQRNVMATSSLTQLLMLQHASRVVIMTFSLLPLLSTPVPRGLQHWLT